MTDRASPPVTPSERGRAQLAIGLARLKSHSEAPALVTSVLIGLLLAILGLWATANALSGPISYFDEGILLSGANSILHGALPIRDFYTNYPPGIFILIAGIWRALGISPVSARLLGFLLHVAIAALGGRLAARCVGRRFSWLAFGLIASWLVVLNVPPFAWNAALAMALLFIELVRLASERGKLIFWVASGFAWGALLAFRHDLFFCFNLVLAAQGVLFVAVHRLRHEGWHPRVSRSCVASFAVGAAIPTLVFWGPILVSTPPSRIVGDLLVEQLRVRLARVRPLPPLMVMSTSPSLRFPLPVFVSETLEGAVALCLAAPALAGLLWFGSKSFAVKDRTAVAMIGALAVAALPQMMGRTDVIHAVYAVGPGLILSAILAEGLALRVRSAILKSVLLLAMALILTFPIRSKLEDLSGSTWLRIPHGPGRQSGLPEQIPDRAEVLAFIAAHSKPDEAIFLGTRQHRLIYANEVDLYYLADRVGATRYSQFDPNVVNRADIQSEMVADLERKRTRVVVLSECCTQAEPNESSKLGAGLLDDYIKRHYRVVKPAGHYLLLLRNDVAASN